MRASASDVDFDLYLVLFLGILDHLDPVVAAIHLGYIHQLFQVRVKFTFSEQKFLCKIVLEHIPDWVFGRLDNSEIVECHD